ncbi:diguanylate cyclase [Nodularia harveyana UHCC-0300]|uniref:Diguanylate cyclase n=1 Tax=Nodularia harveyana UHCC-0300 TaxID=2974287 RepID=A0ABU5UB74_9CYAN|nr:diguanylate cyclase [Nodularia harveyana]MEA5580775.1 diguanylate cyclase [Nodularia harveyana UHCC-0300]
MPAIMFNRLPGGQVNFQSIMSQLRMLAVGIYPSSQLSEMLNMIVAEVRNTLASDRAVIYRILADGDGIVEAESVGPQWIPIKGQLIYNYCCQNKWIKEYQEGKFSTVENILTHPLDPCCQELFNQLQIQANLVVPILVNRRQIASNCSSSTDIWGLLIAHQCSSPRQWSSLEIEFLQLLATQLGTAIQPVKQDQKNAARRSPQQQKLKNFSSSPTDQQNEKVSANIISATDLRAFDRLQTPIWIYDLENYQMWWVNKASLYLWNATSKEELLNRNFSDISEATQIRLKSYLDKFQQGKTVSENWTFYPQGQPVTVSCLLSGVEIEPGCIMMLVEATQLSHDIAPEILRGMEALYHTSLMISVYTMDGVPLMQNPAALDCYGDTQNPSLANENIWLRRFVDRSVGKQAIAAINLGEIFHVETQVFTTKGIRWHNIDIRSTLDPVTGNSLMLVNEKDITKQLVAMAEQQVAEQELRWQEAFLRSMTDSSLLAFLVVDNRTDEILYFNHRFCEIWGLEHLESDMRLGAIKSNDIISYCVNLIADVPAFAKICNPLKSVDNRSIIEDKIAFVDGRTIRRFSSQIRDNQDRYLGRLYIFEDISDRIQAEIAIRDSEERYRSVIAAMAEGIILQKADGRITACNESSEEILGLTADQMIGRTCVDPIWKSIHEDGTDFPGETHPISVTLRTGEPQYNVIMGIYKPDGKLTWISVNSQPLFRRDESTPYAALASFTDITIRKEAQKALQQQVKQEQMIYAIAEKIRHSLDLSEILNTTVAEVRDFLHTDRVIIYRFNPNWSGLVVSESVAPEYKAMLDMEITDTYFVETAAEPYQQGKIKVASDIYTMAFSDCHLQLLEKCQVRSKLVVPIIQDKNLWGLLIAHHCRGPRQWQTCESSLLEKLALQVGIAIQQSELHQQLQTANQHLANLAMVDQLTQLANRRSFDEKLNSLWQQLLRKPGLITLLLCDIDHFKEYNDTYGHAVGDDCLRLVGQAFKKSVKRSTDLAARYGGEEFVVILANTDTNGGVTVAQKIHKAIQQIKIPHSASSVSPYITLSIGIATITPTPGMVPLDLISAADAALYQAKSQGRNRYVVLETET